MKATFVPPCDDRPDESETVHMTNMPYDGKAQCGKLFELLIIMYGTIWTATHWSMVTCNECNLRRPQ